jgi:hypothetical protein
MCDIKGCYGKLVAHGLCQKHYMRLRRYGDPNRVNKRGPKRPEWEQQLRAFLEQGSERSPSTLARQVKAFKLLAAFGAEAQEAGVRHASRPNGSLNVSKLLNFAIMMTLTKLGDEEE